ncbi:MAG: hypothetical protein QMD46_13270 [Methanomicrobiales archaeon]|nr:hypothetical protein [Methanomicrobiales archaeon]MDI6877452.1 hypothetical protein [Methanomicrobiales archaeon]
MGKFEILLLLIRGFFKAFGGWYAQQHPFFQIVIVVMILGIFLWLFGDSIERAYRKIFR